MSFEPIIRIMEDEQSLLVLFDSGYSDDGTRMPRLIRLALPVQDLSLRVERSQEVERVYTISLVVKSSDEEVFHTLATITPGKGDPIILDGEIRQKIASAFSFALEAYLVQKVPVGNAIQQSDLDAQPPLPTPIGTVSRVRENRTHSIGKSIFKPAAIAAVIAGGVWIFSLLFSGTGGIGGADPIQTAIAQNMEQDPASITAQVELTKETLRQMGLDPGAAGDLGCLAPR